MHKNKKIIERIKKLLAMAEGGTIHEKEIAIYQAQRLMAKYHIEEYQVRGLKHEEVVSVESDINVRKLIWQHLMSVIASNFRCENYITIKSNTFQSAVFLGFKTDAEVAKTVFESAYSFATREANNIAAYHSYHYGSAKGVRDEWIIGFISGLKEGFDEQVEYSSETALMVVIPPEVDEAYNAMRWMGDDKVPDSLEPKRNGDKDLYRAGFNQGYEFAHGRKQKSLEEERAGN